MMDTIFIDTGVGIKVPRLDAYGVRGIERLYAQCVKSGIVHPNAPLVKTPSAWGNQEFGILDPSGNLVTFYEPADA